MKTNSKGIKPPAKLNYFSFVWCLNYGSPTDKDSNIPFDLICIQNTQLFHVSDNVVSSKSQTCCCHGAAHRSLCWFTMKGKVIELAGK